MAWLFNAWQGDLTLATNYKYRMFMIQVSMEEMEAPGFGSKCREVPSLYDCQWHMVLLQAVCLCPRVPTDPDSNIVLINAS
jgi:hypothetical protein